MEDLTQPAPEHTESIISDLRDPSVNDGRLESEWLVLNAVRETRRLATKGGQSTYDQALELGAELLPALLGPDVSLIKKARESHTVREFRQRAARESAMRGISVEALELLKQEIKREQELLAVDAPGRVDQIKSRLTKLKKAFKELQPEPSSEHAKIFRDALRVERKLPEIGGCNNQRDYLLPDDTGLRVRVLHPDHPEHLTGADLIYERHHPERDEAAIVAVQYKIWDREAKTLYLDKRMEKQLERLKSFTCDGGLCEATPELTAYRFPFCSAFLRPTEHLQSADQRLTTTGEHLPICKIDACARDGTKRRQLRYDDIRQTSLTHHVFEGLFSHDKIGSRLMSYGELTNLYKEFDVEGEEDRVVLLVQEYEIPGDSKQYPGRV